MKVEDLRRLAGTEVDDKMLMTFKCRKCHEKITWICASTCDDLNHIEIKSSCKCIHFVINDFGVSEDGRGALPNMDLIYCPRCNDHEFDIIRKLGDWKYICLLCTKCRSSVNLSLIDRYISMEEAI